MLNLKKLLEQDSLSGEDVGRLIICNDIRLYTAQAGNTEIPENEVINQEILNVLTEKIDTVEEAEVLECYVQLQNFVKYAQAVSYAYNQQAQNGFCRLLMYMTQAQQVEHARATLEMLPMIMTETQFREMPPPGPVARRRGVALVANNFPCRPKCLDAHDYFVEPDLDCFQEMMSLEHAETMEEKLEYFRNDLMLKGLQYQTAYNTLFSLIAERIGIPEFTAFCTDTDNITQQIAEFNLQRAEFENEIAGEGEKFENKKKILNRIFRPIDIRNTIPSAQAAENVRKQLADIDVFRTSMNQLVSLLMQGGT
ncbi:MAG: hypothetical protein E7496_08155 [Ruminococcus sp.]|nr:hypothetical protein [Ruminococcus sp.]